MAKLPFGNTAKFIHDPIFLGFYLLARYVLLRSFREQLGAIDKRANYSMSIDNRIRDPLESCRLDLSTIKSRFKVYLPVDFLLPVRNYTDNLNRRRVELCMKYCDHRVISDRLHRLLVTLSYFRPDRFVQLLSLIPILILLLYSLVSIDLVYTGLRELVPE